MDVVTCPNCKSVDCVPSVRDYYSCGTCGVFFLPNMDEERLFTYYHSGGYRERHKQADEARHQKRRAEHIIQYIEKASVFVDVGCSMGILMDAVKEKTGAKCYGVDIDTVLTSNVYGDIESVPEPADCVTLIHSLEHMPHPLMELRTIHSRMKWGGQIVIEVPNAAGYKGAFAFPHVVMFDEFSLFWTMKAAGFDVEYVVIHGAGGLLNAADDYYLLMTGRKK